MASRSLRFCQKYNQAVGTINIHSNMMHLSHFTNVGKVGPAVRSTLDIYGITPGQVPATGPQGSILKGDVLKYIREKSLKAAPINPVILPSGMMMAPPSKQDAKSPPPKPTSVSTKTPAKDKTTIHPKPDDGFTDIQLTSMRRTIASRLTESKTTIPHAYATINCVMENVNKMRKDLKDDGVTVSVNDFIIKAAAVALQQVPEVNAIWSGEEARMANNIDISVAVATEKGLITPIVTDAIGIGLEEISHKVRDMATRAKEGKLKPNEFQGGTFTISNLGMFGITEFSAVINPPQVCILAVGSTRLVLDSDGQSQNICTMTLSADARIVSDDIASKFLEAYKYVIENPISMVTHKISDEITHKITNENLVNLLFSK